MAPVTWDDEIDSVLDGDLTAALGYRTPAAGVVVLAVAPVGLRDRAAGTVGFTTSLGFSKKLERIARDPRVALAFHAREHGSAASDAYVLVQGDARVVERPTDAQRRMVREHAAPRLGEPPSGPFWDRWMREYFIARVPVWVHAKRILVWPNLGCEGEPRVLGADLPDRPPEPQSVPRNGTGPRVDTGRVLACARRNAHVLLGFADADGYPVVLPVEARAATADGLELAARASLPAGGRRAGLVAHSYRPKLVGLETRQHTGWLEVNGEGQALYAPHTTTGYKAPANKTLLLLLNGLVAKRGVRAARRARRGTGSGRD